MKELIPSTQVPPLKQELEADEKQGRVRRTKGPCQERQLYAYPAATLKS